MESPTLTLWFDEVHLDDVSRVGGKNASLGELRRSLSALGIRVPNGFATTADAFRAFLAQAGLEDLVRQELATLDVSQVGPLQEAGRRIRHAIVATEFAPELSRSIIGGYRQLEASNASLA
jgi:pyruvate, water dikinase